MAVFFWCYGRGGAVKIACWIFWIADYEQYIILIFNIYRTNDFTTDFSENTGNARIVSINNIRDFIREIREIRGESILEDQWYHYASRTCRTFTSVRIGMDLFPIINIMSNRIF